MKLPFKSVSISTIVHATESEEKLRRALESLLPENVEIEREGVEGHYGDSKVILSADIENRPDLRELWDKILEKLPEGGKEWLAREALDRIADDCRLYLRFDKQEMVSDRRLEFSDTGDVIHVRINIAAYPAKRKIALEKMKEFRDAGFEYE